MTEIPSSNGPAPTSSVVIDTDTKMPATNRGLIAAIVVAAVLAGAFVVWVVAARSDDDYEPGPVAQAFVRSVEESGADVELSTKELSCIDKEGASLDPELLTDDSFELFGENTPDEETLEIAGTIFDECLSRDTRVALFAGSMAAEGDLDVEQATCVGEALDDVFLDAGGYGVVFKAGEDAMGTAMFSILGALGECGLDLEEMMG